MPSSGDCTKGCLSQSSASCGSSEGAVVGLALQSPDGADVEGVVERRVGGCAGRLGATCDTLSSPPLCSERSVLGLRERFDFVFGTLGGNKFPVPLFECRDSGLAVGGGLGKIVSDVEGPVGGIFSCRFSLSMRRNSFCALLLATAV